MGWQNMIEAPLLQGMELIFLTEQGKKPSAIYLSGAQCVNDTILGVVKSVVFP